MVELKWKSFADVILGPEKSIEHLFVLMSLRERIVEFGYMPVAYCERQHHAL